MYCAKEYVSLQNYVQISMGNFLFPDKVFVKNNVLVSYTFSKNKWKEIR